MAEELLKRPGEIEPAIKPEIPERPEGVEWREYLRRRAETTTEILRDPRCTPEIGRWVVTTDLLFPAEKTGLELSSWIVNPILAEIRKRADAEKQVFWLNELNREQVREIQDEINRLTRELDKVSGEERSRRLLDLDRLRARQVWSNELVTAKQKMLPLKEERRAEESKEWDQVYREMEAGASLQAAWYQRTKLESDVDNYAEKLFFSSLMIETVSPSKMVALLETPGVGEAIEKALEIYIDIHLGGEETREKIVQAIEKDDKFSKYLKKKYELEEISEIKDRLNILQQGDAIKKNRELTAEVVQHFCSDKPWAQERGELLARHLATVTLLSVWLGVERDSQTGEIKYYKKQEIKREGEIKKKRVFELPELGICTFEGESQSDLIKLIHFRLKTLSELNKNAPAGPPALVTSLPKYLTQDFFHSAKVGIKEDGTFCFWKDKRRAKEVKPVFDAWYMARKEGKNVSLADVLKEVDEGAFSFWVYVMFRQNRVRKTLLENVGLTAFMLPENLRTLNKDFKVGFGDRVLEREVSKINLIASRIISWTGGYNQEFVTPQQEMDKALVAGAVKLACQRSNFLNSTEWEEVEKVVKRRKALTVKEIIKDADRATLSALLREGERQALRKITKESPEKAIEEIEEAEKFLAKIREKAAERGGESKLTGSELLEIINEVRREFRGTSSLA